MSNETTAWAFQFNTGVFKKATDGIAPDRWLERPSDRSNSLLWVAGHLVWERSGILKILGQSWTRPWCAQFARGLPYANPEQYPAPAEVLTAFDDVSAKLVAAVQNASSELLSQPSPQGLPSADGKIGGGLTFYTIHEGYHLGQLGYLRKWLGYGSALG
jgi:hypothetical protein